MTLIIKNGSTRTETRKRPSAKMVSSIVLSLMLAIMIPFPAPVLAVQLDNCELPDGDVDGDECVTQNLPKNNGGDNPDCNDCAAMAGDPINIATGNKFENEVDYLSGGPSPLMLRRSYNSSDNGVSSFGVGWHGAYSRSMTRTSAYAVDIMRDDGKVLTFTLSGSLWRADSDVNSRLVKLANGWQYTTGLDEIEIYDNNGRLLSITDRAGLTQNLGYDAQGHLVSVTNPFGRSLTFAYTGTRVSSVTVPNDGVYTYRYDAKSNLSTVIYPDNTQRSYVYENTAYPHALTGVIDEKGTRYSTDVYDGAGRDISNELAGGANKYTLNYNYLTYGYVPVKDALNVTRTSTFINLNQVALESLMTQSCPSCPAGYATTKTTTAYDANGNISSQTDFNGNTTHYTYDVARNLQLSRTEAAGTAQARTMTTAWHPSFRLPVSIIEPTRATSFSYDVQGNLLQKTVTAGAQTKTWTLTYNTNAQPLTIDGPRSDVNDVTRFTYDTQGNLNTVTDALGHVTTISRYNADGQPLALKDPNGLATTFQYNPRGKLIASTAGSEATRYSYDAAQQLIKITLPDAAYLAYSYDNAHRLVSIADSLGNHIDYTLDKMGNRLNTQAFDPANALTKTRAQVFDGLSRLAQSIGTQGQTANYDYDANGNATSVSDPLNHKTAFVYDPLNRLISSIDPIGKATSSTYDANNNPLSVTDPLAHTTDYSYDGFGHRLATDSPDTGHSQVSYDDAGNPLSSVDARGQTVNYRYDALNRIIQIHHSNQPPISFTYDQGNNGRGHLTQMGDDAGTTRWTYDGHGRVASKSFKTDSLTLVTRYAYSTNGRLATITYPSGKVVQLGYNNNGQITEIDGNGSPLLSGIHYEPFGSAKDWTFGNGVKTSRSFDLDGRMVDYDLGDRSRQLGYDAASRIIGYTDSDLNYDQSFSYDELGRLTGYTNPTRQTRYSYDANGNRTQLLDGAQNENFNVDASSNRLVSITGNTPQAQKSYSYDAAGHLLSDGKIHFTYDGRGGLVQASGIGFGVEHYQINGLGQRVAKIHSRASEQSENDGHDGGAKESGQRHNPGKEGQSSTYFVYDEAGRLLGEYTRHGTALQETVWLGDMPVAVLAGDRHYFIYADHLNSPRAITDPAGKVVWRWNSDPFGVTDTNANPGHEGHDKGIDEDADHDGHEFVYNLRFPGQYYDKGTGLHYNHFRDYDPGTGRYIESDPIGLAGGINTYAYVGNNPLIYTDPLGLTAQGAAYGAAFFGGATALGSLAVDAATGGVNILATPAEIAAASAAGAVVGDVVSDFANNVSNAVDNSNFPGYFAKGERGYSGNAGGTNNPDKHWKDDPKNPGWGWQKDPQTGKKTYKKRPPYLPSKCP